MYVCMQTLNCGAVRSAPDVFGSKCRKKRCFGNVCADIPLPRNHVFLSSGVWLHAMFAATVASRTCSCKARAVSTNGKASKAKQSHEALN